MTARFHRSTARRALLTALLMWTPLIAQDPPEPLANRALSGAADFGDLGRRVQTSSGNLLLGTIDLTSEMFSGEDPLSPTASHTIEVNSDGFAFLSNGLVIKSASGTDAVFDGPNQSHTFEVYRRGGLGAFSYDQAGLTGSTSHTDANDETVAAYGGKWQWSATYNTLDGSEFQVSRDVPEFSSDNHTSAGTLRPLATFNHISNPSTLASLGLTDNGTNELQRRLVEGTEDFGREDVLLSAANVPEQAAPVIDVSGTAISGSGTQLRNRAIGTVVREASHPLGEFVSAGVSQSLGRVMRQAGTLNVDRTDTLSVATTGNDNERTRLNLAGLNQNNGAGVSVQSVGGSFDSGDDTVDVSVTGNFSVDTNVLGNQSFTVDVGGSITSAENLSGESVQDSLQVGYSFSAVDENALVSQNVTAYRLDNATPSNHSVRGRVWQEFSTVTHTDIGFQELFPLSGADQTISLSKGNGVYAEGLAGEQVTASTSFEIQEVTVDASDLVVDGAALLDHNDTVTLSNERAANAARVQAESMLVRDVTKGSSRWTLAGLDQLSLTAGAENIVTAQFDDAGLSEPAEGQLGQTFRTHVDLTFQDGVRNLGENGNYSVGNVWGESSGDFEIAGSWAGRRTVGLNFEKRSDVQAASGTTTLAVGSRLGEQGLNLTNLDTNSFRPQDPTRFQIIDGASVATSVEVSVGFTNRDEADIAFMEANGFDQIVSDLVQVDGLDGVFHVIELTYDSELTPAAELLWFSDESQWVNSILGNSDIESFDVVTNMVTAGGDNLDLDEFLSERFFAGSYFDYLDSLEGAETELGRYGYMDGKAWATIDHNSMFAVASSVPEPSSAMLLVMAVGTATLRRRRKVEA